MEEQHDWLRTVLWTDEAHFTLSGAVNTHHCRVWTTGNQHAFVEVPLQQPKVTVCFPLAGATAYQLLHRSNNRQVANRITKNDANLALSPTFRYVTIISPS
ncbi:transposable element tc3 transposase [Trichonephila clavipes]|nr:transposable element tc3 transposase [Trichonephila clavipes]